MAEVPFRPARQLSEYKGKGASASRETKEYFVILFCSRSDKLKYLRLAANFISKQQRILKRRTFIIKLVRSFDANVRDQ